MLEWIILATIAVSLISLVGVILLGLKDNLMRRILVFLVAFAVGAMMGGAFVHLIPESLESIDAMMVFILVFAGFMTFFVVEKFLHWRHCHENNCDVHNEKLAEKSGRIKPAAYLNLIGDGVHNFFDGLIIATSFITSVEVGIASTIAIMLHEIPQEFGDFAVLVHSGMSTRKALVYNLISAIVAVAGGILGYFFLTHLEWVAPYMLAASAGGFLYIAAVDLVPEMHNEWKPHVSLLQFSAILLGFVLMYYMKILLGG